MEIELHGNAAAMSPLLRFDARPLPSPNPPYPYSMFARRTTSLCNGQGRQHPTFLSLPELSARDAFMKFDTFHLQFVIGKSWLQSKTKLLHFFSFFCE